jgi:hypothetical protein
VTETAIQKQIIDCARAMGYKPFRMNSGQARNNVKLHAAGTPDLLIIMPRGRSLWVEVKRPGQHPTAIQMKRHKELRDMGHACTVCRSVEEFVEAVKEITA